MNTQKTILISEGNKNFLVSREAVQALFSELSDSNTIYKLNFSNVEFMSRSYADQFYKMKLDFECNTNNEIHILNANEEIINVLQAVAKTQKKADRSYEHVPVFRFSKLSMLSDYLLTI